MAERTDKYPTRIDGIGQILTREESVIHDRAGADNGPLTADQRKSFEAQGYLSFESFFDAGTVEALCKEMEDLRISEKVRQSELAITEPTTGETRSVFAVHTVNEIFGQLARDARLLGIVEQLLGKGVYLHQSRLNLKPGFRGDGFYWHSDYETWHAEDGMPDMRALSCSIALTDKLGYNGPLMLLPGSHKYFCQCTGTSTENHYNQVLARQDFGVPSDDQLEWLANKCSVDVPMGPAGSIVIFDCNLMHGSNNNITPFPRRNVIFAYNSLENTLEAPYAAEHERPWFYANREPEALKAAAEV